MKRFFNLIIVLAIAAGSLLMAFSWLKVGIVQAQNPPPVSNTAVGDVLARIQCSLGYTATVYAEGLSSPDGLAFSPDGVLYVSEESSGEVSSISSDGTVTTVLSGLTGPEGIAFDDSGNLYVVEDIANGRLIKRTSSGVISTLFTGLVNSEGIAWNATDDTLYITESNIENALKAESTTPSDYQTYVSSVSMSGTHTRLLTTTGLVTPSISPLKVNGTFWSYAAIDLSQDGKIYISNELSGKKVQGTFSGVPYEVNTTGSVFTTPMTINSVGHYLFADGLVAPEGMRFSANGTFPLYVAEEDTTTTFPPPDDGQGRLSQVSADGTVTTLCTGFKSIEDVAVDTNGWLYISEDESSAGRVIQLKPAHSIYKMVSDATPILGLRFTYTIAVENQGTLLTGAIISDTLPAGVTFAGPVSIEGSTGQVAQSSGDLPILVSNLVLSAGTRMTVTLPVSVSSGTVGERITNTVALSHSDIVSVMNSVGFTLVSGKQYFPIILKNADLGPN